MIYSNYSIIFSSFWVSNSNIFKATVKDSNFTDSYVTGEDETPSGGAIYIYEANATIEGSIFNHSTVSSDVGEGGAIFVQGNYANVSGSEFESSSAKTGGAVYLEGNSATVSDSTFTSSHANENGGAMYSTGSNSLVSNSNFTDNFTMMLNVNTMKDGGLGGAPTKDSLEKSDKTEEVQDYTQWKE